MEQFVDENNYPLFDGINGLKQERMNIITHSNLLENGFVYVTNGGTQIVKISAEYENLSNDMKLHIIKELNEWTYNEAMKIFKQIK